MKLALLLLALAASPALAQSAAASAPVPAWQTAAGGHLEFEVASIRPDTGEFKPPSFALSSDDGFPPPDGAFHADFPITVYIEFAYKLSLSPEQRKLAYDGLPKWVTTDRFLIQARSPGKPTKDQVRLMMQSLLAERFGLRLHFESRDTAVLLMTLAKPGVLGPRLIHHSDGPPCPEPGAVPTDTSIFPSTCGSYVMHRLPNHNARMGSRDTTMQMLGTSLTSLNGLGRPVVDQTGLTGHYDFSIEFSPAASNTSATPATDSTETPGPSVLEAVHDQLGLKLDRGTTPMEIPVIDHIARPSEN